MDVNKFLDAQRFLDHGGRRSIRSIGRSRDRFDRFDKFSDFLARQGAQDLSGVKVSALYDAWRPKKTLQNQNANIWIFCQVRFGRFDNPFGSIDRAIDRIDWFGRFGMILDFLEMSGSSRFVMCQSFSSVSRLEPRKTSKKQNEKKLDFLVKFGSVDSIIRSVRSIMHISYMGDGGPP